MAHNPDPGHIDFYEESDVLSARDKFQDNAGLPTLPEGVDYFANSLYSRAAFRTLLLDKAANASFALTPEIKTKITTAVTQAFAVSDEASSAAPAKFKGLGQ